MSKTSSPATAFNFFHAKPGIADSVSSNTSQSFASVGSLPKTPRTAKSHFMPMSMTALKFIKAIFTKLEAEITPATPDASHSGASSLSIYTNFSWDFLSTGSSATMASNTINQSRLTAKVLNQLNNNSVDESGTSTDSTGDVHSFDFEGIVIPGIKPALETLINHPHHMNALVESTFSYRVSSPLNQSQNMPTEVHVDTHPSFSSQGSNQETMQNQPKKRSLLGFLRNMCAGQAPQVREFMAAPVAGNMMEINAVEYLNKPLDEGTYVIEKAEDAAQWLTDLNASSDVLHGFSPFWNHKKSTVESPSK